MNPSTSRIVFSSSHPLASLRHVGEHTLGHGLADEPVRLRVVKGACSEAHETFITVLAHNTPDMLLACKQRGNTQHSHVRMLRVADTVVLPAAQFVPCEI